MEPGGSIYIYIYIYTYIFFKSPGQALHRIVLFELTFVLYLYLFDGVVIAAWCNNHLRSIVLSWMLDIKLKLNLCLTAPKGATPVNLDFWNWLEDDSTTG